MAELVDAHDSKSCFARSESSILSSPTRNMNLDNLNNLIELFSLQANKQNKKDIFLNIQIKYKYQLEFYAMIDNYLYHFVTTLRKDR